MPTPKRPSWATQPTTEKPKDAASFQVITTPKENESAVQMSVGSSGSQSTSTDSSDYQTPKESTSKLLQRISDSSKLKNVNLDSKQKTPPQIRVTHDIQTKDKSDDSKSPKKASSIHLSVHARPFSFSASGQTTNLSPSTPFPQESPKAVLFKSPTPSTQTSQPTSDKKILPQPSQTPQQPSQTPQQPSQIPQQHSQTPQQPSQTPQQHAQTPQQPSQTPQQPSQTPQQHAQTPKQHSQTPQQPSQTPQQHSPQRSVSPNQNMLPKYSILEDNLKNDEKPFPEDYKVLYNYFREENLKAFQNYLKENPKLLENFHEIRNVCGGNLLAAAAFRKMSSVSVLISELDKDLFSQQIGLLIAVDLNNYEMMLLILRRTKILKKNQNLSNTLLIPYHGQTGISNKYLEDYPQYVVPMLLACEKDDFISIKILLSYGHRLHTPHEIGCHCYVCASDKDYSLSEAIARYRYFKGLTSPAYICLTNTDPVLRAFRLKKKLQKSAEKEPEFASEYLELSQKCIDFATELLELCRTREEALILLSQSSEFKTCTWMPMNRVVQALQLECGDFVAHSTCQQVLTEEWYRNNQWIKTSSYLHITLVLVLNTILFPLNALFQIIAPLSQFAERQKSPSKRYMNYISSYAIFLALTFSIEYLTISRSKRGTVETSVVYILVIYVIGMWVEKFTLVYKRGKRIFLMTIWNLYDVLMLTFYTLTFLLWGICSREDGINTLFNDTPREYWPSSEPNLVTEICFTVAILLSFGRLFSFMQSSKVIGPLQICAVRMILYVGPFMLILSIVWFSFAVCLFIIYSYYTSLNLEKLDEVETIHFTSFWQSIHFVIWLFLGLYEKTFGRLVVPEIKVRVGTNETILRHQHTLTQKTGFAVIDLFYLLGMVLLLNMLIAIMTDAYAEICESSIKEFKVNRTKLWLGYFYQEQQYPPPFNLIPKLLTFYKICTKTNLKDSKMKRSPYIVGKDDEVYQELMDRLVKRYFRMHYNEELVSEGNQAIWQEK